jgi:hypothetical protein
VRPDARQVCQQRRRRAEKIAPKCHGPHYAAESLGLGQGFFLAPIQMRLKPLPIDDERTKARFPSSDPVLLNPLPDRFRAALCKRGGFEGS